ncbi:hypothetical protein ACR78N_04140 [Sphingobacterium siyangense]|uniref:hypothetical protein n=1 Tax=Sphingobacterium siyangense TaxID=459529 RepID=UPI003DA43AF0
MSHSINIKTAGKNLEQAEKAIVMIHGRGGSAEDILGMSSYLHVDNLHYLHRRQKITLGTPILLLLPYMRTSPG